MGIRRLLMLQLLCAISLFAVAQNGKIKGLVTDEKTNEPLVGATVMLERTTTGTVTDFDGKYAIESVPPGTYTLRCSFISYETKLLPDISIKAGQELEFNFQLGESTVEIGGVDVVAKANRESESMLLMDQKEAAVSRESIGAKQLSAQGVSDAASAAAKITGVTKQEGSKTLNIRGLGDRYNTTTLNGLPLPSNNAENKNIDLELFSTDIIEFISVEKAFTPSMLGDCAGANVNISSKKQRGSDFLNVGIKSGFNTETSNADEFYLSDGPGYFGFYNTSGPTSLDSYNVFKNKWNPQKKTVYPTSGLSMATGKSFRFEHSALNAFLTASFDNEYKYSGLLERKINASDIEQKDLEGTQYSYETQTTGMLNLNYQKGTDNYYFNSIFLNTSDQSLKDLRGYVVDVAEDSALVRRSEFERNTVWVNQLLGEHEFSKKMKMEWGLAYNNIHNIIPDRRHNTMDGTDPDYKFFATNDQSNNNRYFHDLKENELAANASFDYSFGEPFDGQDYRGKLTVGYSGKYKDRSFIATQFNHKIITNQTIDVMDIDSYFNDANLQAGYFKVRTFSSNYIISSTYDGKQFINAGFLNLEYNLSQKLLFSGGLRLENVYQKIEYSTTLDEGEGDFNELKFLPDFALKYALNDKSNLRFSSGITYTLPQFKETALFLFEGITDAVVGNPYLYPSKDYNADLKWEYFPKTGELLSAAVFGKYISNPINKFVMASASNDYTYANTGDWAQLYGLELEARKNIINIENEAISKKLFLIANMTLMYTNQKLDNKKINEETEGLVNSNFIQNHEELQGAAPLIANASLSYTMKWKNSNFSLTPTVIYAYTSDRLFLIGYSKIGKQVDKAINNLDIVIKSKIKHLGISLSAKNILNPNIDRMQENESQDFLIRSYKKGTKISFGLSYEF